VLISFSSPSTKNIHLVDTIPLTQKAGNKQNCKLFLLSFFRNPLSEVTQLYYGKSVFVQVPLAGPLVPAVDQEPASISWFYFSSTLFISTQQIVKPPYPDFIKGTQA
jgi:hypothetical protein